MSTGESKRHRDPQILPDPDAAATERVGRTDSDPARRALRAELGKYVSLAEFPARMSDIIAAAEENVAPDEVLEHLRAIPRDATFDRPSDLWAALQLEATDRF
jgi:uncharacterized protein DUF2795